MHFVNEQLLIGNIEDAQQPPPYVNAVLFLSAEHEITPPKGVAYVKVSLKEYAEADPLAVKNAVDWLEQQDPKHRLLVCCRAGMGRSVSMAIAYLCLVKGMSYAEAEQLLKARRPGATPLPRLEQTIEKVRQMKQARDGQGQTPGQHAAQDRVQDIRSR
jgi:protein-tyrosine phosphatase